MARSRPTIRDVAGAAGVSVATVSHALNDKGRLDIRTRERVRQIATELGYNPNPRARALRTGSGNTIGIVSSLIVDGTPGHDSTMDWYMRTAVAAANECLAQGYALTLVPPSDQQNWAQSLAVDGALLVDPDHDDPAIAALVARGLPVIVISGDATRDDVTTVTLDRASAVSCAMRHFAARDRVNPALLVESSGRQSAEGTRLAFVAWCAERGITPRVAVAPAADAKSAAGYAATLDLLRNHPDTDAIYSPLDLLAHGAAAALIAADRTDVALVTAEGMIARLSNPPMTAVDTKRELQAATATRMLIAQLRTGIRPPSQIFTADLIVRD
ncbi:LacI family DNA-binding transcriptional regulator [Nocardia sp. NPDC058666]|uniref:LacI family DNA-binding transcriptional regulator n=1 Tax=unclassified Nocardia TaxID=2637762 RepID=UPI00366980E9